MPEGGSPQRLPPPGSYPSKQVSIYPRVSVRNSIAKLFNISSFLFQLTHQTSWIIEDKISSKITSAPVRLLGYLYACSIPLDWTYVPTSPYAKVCVLYIETT